MMIQVNLSKHLGSDIEAATRLWAAKYPTVPATTLFVEPGLVEAAQKLTNLNVVANQWCANKLGVGVVIMPDAKEVGR